ncbi:MAG: alpha/beta hydrolase [Bryobacterales bacterium]|nr:alpha/beta hydrolase [Bryobacterales bacterium]
MKILLLLAVTLSLSAASFRVELAGSKGKPPMILIPGLSSSGDVWKETVARYKDRYECHVLTLAGFAGVPIENKEPGMLTRVRTDLVAYIRDKKLAKPTIVGHSLGGFLALWLASSDPTLVGDLVIVDALPHLAAVYGPGFSATAMRDMIANQPKEQYDQFMQSGVSLRGMAASPAHLEIIKQWGIKSDQWAVANGMYELLSKDLSADIARIRSRTLVLGSWSGMKSVTTREIVDGNFRKQYAALPGHRFALAETAQHFIMYDDPNWFFAQVDSFLLPNGSK